MIAELLPGLEKLTREQKCQLVEELNAEILADDPTEPVDMRSAIGTVLETRIKEFEADPSEGSPWSEVRERLRARLKH
jgi:putative addiction module component (TIGR02574 family)